MNAPQTEQNTPLIQLEKLSKHFPIHKGFFNQKVGEIKAVTEVDLTIHRGETLGLVGESGCGKSTIGRSILQLLRPSNGKVLLENRDLTQLSTGQLRPVRKDMQIVFQNPYSSLNPRMTVGDIVAEPLEIHRILKGKALKDRVFELLDMVGLPKDAYGRYPHEFSGGQRQRVGIARAIALNPKFIVADEPVSALDVSVQAQILNLLDDLKKEFNLTYLFIAHNLSVVEYISDRVAVMYLGKIVEVAPAKELYEKPLHPYTQALLSAIPIPDPDAKHDDRKLLEGDLPSKKHVHTVVRTPNGNDYGKDLLRQHLETHPH
ncbi:MAG: ATP-binding cassette domain-containing protein [Vampirovibrio sp.]|nr:ATP-binding cassette domain-containing protein [Vampirovibrio sp.]